MIELTSNRPMSKKEVARFLGVSTRSIERWIAAGKFPKPCTPQGTVKRWHREQFIDIKNPSEEDQQ